ncbi:TOBE domain-containing protein [Azohydromonas australica]|uniref:TOBE domain-containing protein n=1 Tax=Azohydromonas australica TaxID=364039 RepID=UPI0003FFB369|nr:TOBE domain-containing protein [Azohydromonas australica]
MSDTSLLTGELKLAGRLDARFFALLEAIEATGSLNRAAATAGYSYRGAWLVLEAAANLVTQPLLERSVGGAHGGGSRLTPTAYALLDAWHHLQATQREYLRIQEAWLLQRPQLLGVLKRLSIKATARNQFAGTISAVEPGPVTSLVTVALAGGQEIVATLTSTAVRRLQARPGADAIAMVSSSSVALVTDFEGYRMSARNQLAGTVSRIGKGDVASLVHLTLPGGAVITSSVVNEEAEGLDLLVGQPTTAVFKAYAVTVAMTRHSPASFTQGKSSPVRSAASLGSRSGRGRKPACLRHQSRNSVVDFNESRIAMGCSGEARRCLCRVPVPWSRVQCE